MLLALFLLALPAYCRVHAYTEPLFLDISVFNVTSDASFTLVDPTTDVVVCGSHLAVFWMQSGFTPYVISEPGVLEFTPSLQYLQSGSHTLACVQLAEQSSVLARVTQVDPQPLSFQLLSGNVSPSWLHNDTTVADSSVASFRVQIEDNDNASIVYFYDDSTTAYLARVNASGAQQTLCSTATATFADAFLSNSSYLSAITRHGSEDVYSVWALSPEGDFEMQVWTCTPSTSTEFERADFFDAQQSLTLSFPPHDFAQLVVRRRADNRPTSVWVVASSNRSIDVYDALDRGRTLRTFAVDGEISSLQAAQHDYRSENVDVLAAVAVDTGDVFVLAIDMALGVASYTQIESFVHFGQLAIGTPLSVSDGVYVVSKAIPLSFTNGVSTCFVVVNTTLGSGSQGSPALKLDYVDRQTCLIESPQPSYLFYHDFSDGTADGRYHVIYNNLVGIPGVIDGVNTTLSIRKRPIRRVSTYSPDYGLYSVQNLDIPLIGCSLLYLTERSRFAFLCARVRSSGSAFVDDNMIFYALPTSIQSSRDLHTQCVRSEYLLFEEPRASLNVVAFTLDASMYIVWFVANQDVVDTARSGVVAHSFETLDNVCSAYAPRRAMDTFNVYSYEYSVNRVVGLSFAACDSLGTYIGVREYLASEPGAEGGFGVLPKSCAMRVTLASPTDYVVQLKSIVTRVPPLSQVVNGGVYINRTELRVWHAYVTHENRAHINVSLLTCTNSALTPQPVVLASYAVPCGSSCAEGREEQLHYSLIERIDAPGDDGAVWLLQVSPDADNSVRVCDPTQCEARTRDFVMHATNNITQLSSTTSTRPAQGYDMRVIADIPQSQRMVGAALRMNSTSVYPAMRTFQTASYSFSSRYGNGVADILIDDSSRQLQNKKSYCDSTSRTIAFMSNGNLSGSSISGSLLGQDFGFAVFDDIDPYASCEASEFENLLQTHEPTVQRLSLHTSVVDEPTYYMTCVADDLASFTVDTAQSNDAYVAMLVTFKLGNSAVNGTADIVSSGTMFFPRFAPSMPDFDARYIECVAAFRNPLPTVDTVDAATVVLRDRGHVLVYSQVPLQSSSVIGAVLPPDFNYRLFDATGSDAELCLGRTDWHSERNDITWLYYPVNGTTCELGSDYIETNTLETHAEAYRQFNLLRPSADLISVARATSNMSHTSYARFRNETSGAVSHAFIVDDPTRSVYDVKVVQEFVTDVFADNTVKRLGGTNAAIVSPLLLRSSNRLCVFYANSTHVNVKVSRSTQGMPSLFDLIALFPVVNVRDIKAAYVQNAIALVFVTNASLLYTQLEDENNVNNASAWTPTVQITSVSFGVTVYFSFLAVAHRVGQPFVALGCSLWTRQSNVWIEDNALPNDHCVSGMVQVGNSFAVATYIDDGPGSPFQWLYRSSSTMFTSSVILSSIAIGFYDFIKPSISFVDDKPCIMYIFDAPPYETRLTCNSQQNGLGTWNESQPSILQYPELPYTSLTVWNNRLTYSVLNFDGPHQYVAIFVARQEGYAPPYDDGFEMIDRVQNVENIVGPIAERDSLLVWNNQLLQFARTEKNVTLLWQANHIAFRQSTVPRSALVNAQLHRSAHLQYYSESVVNMFYPYAQDASKMAVLSSPFFDSPNTALLLQVKPQAAITHLAVNSKAYSSDHMIDAIFSTIHADGTVSVGLAEFVSGRVITQRIADTLLSTAAKYVAIGSHYEPEVCVLPDALVTLATSGGTKKRQTQTTGVGTYSLGFAANANASVTPAPTPFPTVDCSTVLAEDLSEKEPALFSVDLQDNYTQTLHTVAVADFFQSSLYTESGTGNLLQRVYWRGGTTASEQEFRRYEFYPTTPWVTAGDAFNASTLSDAAATAMASRDSVLFALATTNHELQVYVLQFPQDSYSDIVVEALNTTLVLTNNSCTAESLLVDVECDWHVSASVQCYVFALECGTLHTYVFDDTSMQLVETSCTHAEYDYSGALHFQVEVPSFPSETASGVLLTNVLVSTVQGDVALNQSELPVWRYVAHVCDPSLQAPNATVSITIRTFERSSVAAADAGAMVLRTQTNSTKALGAYRVWLLLPSPNYANLVDFFDPMYRSDTLVSQDTGQYIYRLAASHTDYPQRNVDALFVASFLAPEENIMAALIADDGDTFRSSTTAFTTLSVYDERTLSMGTVYELLACDTPLPIVAVSLANNGGSDVLRFDFFDAAATAAPTVAPTPAPLSYGVNDEPIRHRTNLQMPNSVIGGSIMHGACANNTWVRAGADEHCDNCVDGYASAAVANNNSKPLWFSFETQHDPAAYLIYTDPAGPECAECCTDEQTYLTTPLRASAVSLWSHCYYNAPVAGVDACSSDGVAGMESRHGFLGPLCLPPSTVHKVRVRGDTPADVGDFDVTVEEWALRRGGDRCADARALDFIELGANDQNNCGSAVYTNLCAPPAGRDLWINCQQIDSVNTPTTWFSYETNVGPSELSFLVRFDDARSMVSNGTLPFAQPLPPSLAVNYTISVWRACETLLQTPLACETRSGVLDAVAGRVDFAPLVIQESASVTFSDKKLRPHTKYYVAVSTSYQGDFALCATEQSDIVIEPTPPPQTGGGGGGDCVTTANAGDCSDVCSITPCDAQASLDSYTFVQKFDPSVFTEGDYGASLSANMPGVDVVAYGKACRCCMQPMLFNSSAPSGNDCELGTPNRRFGGPGCGAGGAEGDGVNFNDQGLCLIVSEDGDTVDPDSLRESGVVLSVNFCSTVQLLYVVFINARRGTTMTLFDGDGEDYPSIAMRMLGANAVYNRSFDDARYAAPFISKMEIEFGQGGACIAEFAYRIVGLNDICACAAAPFAATPAADGSGACCAAGGTECFDYPDRVVCDTVKRGKWHAGRSCSEGNVCPHEEPAAGEFWGWKHDSAEKEAKNRLSHNDKHWGYSKTYHHKHSHEESSSSSYKK